MDTERHTLRSARRMVVKLGTNVVMQSDRGPALERLAGLVAEIARLRSRVWRCCLSPLGRLVLGREAALGEVPKKLVDRQPVRRQDKEHWSLTASFSKSTSQGLGT